MQIGWFSWHGLFSSLQDISDSVLDSSAKTELQSIANDMEGYCDEF